MPKRTAFGIPAMCPPASMTRMSTMPSSVPPEPGIPTILPILATEKTAIDNIPDVAITSMDEIVIANDMTSVIAACAQAESESISQNMKWSIQKKMQNGTYVASSVPFGFRRINGNLVVEESEARYVRYVFSNYLAGKRTSDIAKELTAQGAADPVLGSRKWSFQAIVEMLKNEKYIGDAMYQKTYMTDIRSHGGQQWKRKNPAEKRSDY